jgi:hypothetical protein
MSYYSKHKEERLNYAKDYYKKNKNVVLLRNEKYRKEHMAEILKTRYKNHPDYWKEYFRKLKKWAVDKLGRKCSRCGLVSEFDCVYDFHHENGLESWSKEKNPSNMRIKELIKWRKADSIPIDCKLLCANCHRIKTQLII